MPRLTEVGDLVVTALDSEIGASWRAITDLTSLTADISQLQTDAASNTAAISALSSSVTSNNSSVSSLTSSVASLSADVSSNAATLATVIAQVSDLEGVDYVAEISTALGSTAWQSGGGTLTNEQIVTAINTELSSTAWQTDTKLSNTEVISAIDAELGSEAWKTQTVQLTGEEIVALIDTALGSEIWKSGGTSSVPTPTLITPIPDYLTSNVGDLQTDINLDNYFNNASSYSVGSGTTVSSSNYNLSGNIFSLLHAATVTGSIRIDATNSDASATIFDTFDYIVSEAAAVTGAQINILDIEDSDGDNIQLQYSTDADVTATVVIYNSATADPAEPFVIDDTNYPRFGTVDLTTSGVDIPLNNITLSDGDYKLALINPEGEIAVSPSFTVVTAVAQSGTLGIIGASIMQMSFGAYDAGGVQSADSEQLLSGLGYDGWSVLSYATGATFIADAFVRLQEFFAEYPSGYAMIHTGGNNVSSSQPYSSATAAQLQTMEDDYGDIVAYLQANGLEDRVIFSNLSFRDYDEDDSRFQDESLGSLPYNENILEPLLSGPLASGSWSNGRPRLDFYRFVKLNYENTLQDWVHPNFQARGEIRQFFMEKFAEYLDGDAAPNIANRVFGDAAIDYPDQDIYGSTTPVGGTSGNDAFVSFGPTVIDQADGALNIINSTNIETDVSLVDVSGVDTGLTLNLSATGAGVFQDSTAADVGWGQNGNSGRAAGTAWDGTTIYSTELTVGNIFGGSQVVQNLVLSGFDPNEVATLSFLGTRNTTAARPVQVTDGTVSVQWNSEEDPVAPAVPTQFTADASGIITLEVNSAGSTTYNYLSAMQIERA